MKFKDLTGIRYGRLTVLSLVLPKTSPAYWLCRCDCGNVKTAKGGNLRDGKTNSCGCLRGRASVTHGDSRGGEFYHLYSVWHCMRQRCRNPNNRQWEDYGGRGVTVCDEWHDDYAAFKLWAIDAGWVRGLDIDRIDNGRGYAPENCRVTTSTINSRNRRSAKGSSSAYVGVYLHKSSKKWQAAVTIDKETKHLGTFRTEYDAAVARDKFIIANGLQGFTLNLKPEEKSNV